MKTFVLIFRQGPQTRTDADKLRLFEETGPWARSQNEAGHKLGPHILESESAHFGPENDTVAGAWPVSALLFLEAEDLAAAAAVAQSHPGLRYGANVELRPWSPPGRPASTSVKP